MSDLFAIVKATRAASRAATRFVPSPVLRHVRAAAARPPRHVPTPALDAALARIDAWRRDYRMAIASGLSPGEALIRTPLPPA